MGRTEKGTIRAAQKRKLIPDKEQATDSDSSGTSEEGHEKKIAAKNLEEYYKRRRYTCSRTTDEGTLCTKAYYSSGDLNRHVKQKHDKRRDHICSECGKSFLEKSNLKDHISLVHEKTREHICDTCRQGFCSKANLERHNLEVHHIKSERIQCTLCTSTFDSIESLQIHTQRFHKTKIEEPENQTIISQNIFSESSQMTSQSTGDPPNDNVLMTGKTVLDNSIKTVAVILSQWTPERDPGSIALKVRTVECGELMPNFENMVANVRTNFSKNRNKQRPKNVTCKVLDDKSFYFKKEEDYKFEAEIAKTAIVIVQSFLNLLRARSFKRKITEPKENAACDFSTTVKLKSQKGFLDKILLDNQLKWQIEDAAQFLARKEKRGKTLEDFRRLNESKYISAENKHLGIVYMVHTRIHGRLYLYIGTRRNDTMAEDDLYNRNRRISSKSHTYAGTLHDFISANPDAVFEERLLFHLNENGEPMFPVGESIAILAFFLMQQSTGMRLQPKQAVEPFTLINLQLNMPTWDRDFIFGLRKLIYYYSGKRFSFAYGSNFVVPEVLNVQAVFSVLGAMKFKDN